jgi:hypothetical protein
MNPRTRKAALYAIGVIAILASGNALAHSYAGLYDWAVGHRLNGWQAASWPAEIDVFLAVGELALYVAYLDGWQVRQRIWPWTAAIVGLAVSVAGNIGHIQSAPGQPVILSDRLTAATSPIAAFAGLAIGLLVLKMTRPQPVGEARSVRTAVVPDTQPEAPGWLANIADQRTKNANLRDEPEHGGESVQAPAHADSVVNVLPAGQHAVNGGASWQDRSGASGKPTQELLRAASVIYQIAAANGERLSQRILASKLRDHGHHFSNQHLHAIAASIGLTPPRAA